MSMRPRDWLLFPVRTPGRAAMSAAVVAVLVAGVWQGLRVLRFQRDQAAAREALAKYDFPEARRRLASCLALWPNDTETLLLAAQAARRDGLLDEARDHLDRYADRVEGSSPEAALQGVLLRVQRGQVTENVYALLDFVEVRHPDSEQILESLASGSVHVYRLDEAAFFTKQLLDRFPANPVGWLIAAQSSETLRRPDRPLEIARRLVKDYPSFDKARLYLAGLLSKGHHYNEAADHYRHLHGRQPAELMSLLGLIRALLTLGRIDEAEPLLSELQERHPNNSEALLERARFALRQKRPADAESLLRRAVRLAPNDPDVHFELATSLGQLNRMDESNLHLKRYKQIQSDMMDLDKAFQAMTKAPNDPAPRVEAGRVCLRNGQDQEGLRWLHGALQVNPSYGPAHAALAEFYEQRGDPDRAATHRRKAGEPRTK
jgi:predicted Zn-dependent protease